jgi:hypothetical protein
MGKMYTLAIVSKVAQREAKLGSLLSDSDEVFDIPFEFIWNKNGKLKKEISLHTKAYKTLGGASRECAKINKKYADKSMRLVEGYILNGRWTTSFTFDTSQYSFAVIDITEKWNQHIDKEVEKETAKYNREVQKLKSLKV